MAGTLAYGREIGFGSPKKDTPAKDINAEYKKQVEDFRANVPSLKNQLFAGAADASKRDLVDKYAGIRSNASSRGLLYGGLHQGAKDQAMAESAGQLAGQRYAINTGLDQALQGADAAQLNRLLEAYRSDVESAANQYQSDQARNASKQGLLGSLLGSGIGAGAILAASDENLKTDIEPGEREVTELLDSVKPQSYRYKDEKWGEGRRVSPMAQDLEKSEIGKSAVINTPEGKIVDYGNIAGAMLAAQSALHKRLKKLEAK